MECIRYLAASNELVVTLLLHVAYTYTVCISSSFFIRTKPEKNNPNVLLLLAARIFFLSANAVSFPWNSNTNFFFKRNATLLLLPERIFIARLACFVIDADVFKKYKYESRKIGNWLT